LGRESDIYIAVLNSILGAKHSALIYDWAIVAFATGLGGSLEQTRQFDYIELHVEINLSIPASIGV